ncbi:hypothetical protein AX14_004955 [Amanita brunnescens Koide BX004]|nr:hypothetical protein AX14_004955 [Amanita brunnescens Koide BX004]
MEAKKAAGDCPKHAVACNIPGHKLTNCRICKGLNTPSNFGQWFQACRTCQRLAGKHAGFKSLSEALVSAQYFNDRVQQLTREFKGLEPTSHRSTVVNSDDGGSSHSAPTPSRVMPPPPLPSSPPLPLPSPLMSPVPLSSPVLLSLSSPSGVLSSSPLLPLPSPSTPPPTPFVMPSPIITPAGMILDNGGPILAIFWNQGGERTVITTVFPRRDGFLYLEDFRIKLGAIHVEQMNSLETYVGHGL